MANQIFLGSAAAIAQVTSLTVGGTAANGQVYSVTMGFGAGKTVSYTATGTDTNTTIATALQKLLAASQFPEFLEEGWTNPSTAVIYATMLTAGVPFTLSCSATGTGTLTQATVTANSGPSDVSIASNWSTGTLPVTGDTIYFQNCNVAALYNLQALSAVDPANIYCDASMTAAIGLPVNNANGYREYRQRFLQFTGCSGIVEIGLGQGQGSGKIQLDFQSGNFTANIYKSATSSETGMPAVQLKGGAGTTVINHNKGTLGIALTAGETATVPTLNINYVNNQAGDAQVWTGPGCTLTTVNMGGGQLSSRCAVPTLNSTGGQATLYAGNMTAANLENAGQGAPNSTLYYCPPAGGTISSYSIGDGCLLDCSLTQEPVTLTGGTLYAGSTINAPDGNVTMTNAASIPDGQASDITLNLGNNRTIKVV